MDTPKVELMEVSVAAVRLNPRRPQRTFTEAELEMLAASIKEHGVQNPIRVRQVPGEDGAYELITGEGRLRASKIVGLEMIPARVGDVDLLVLVESVQRQDISPIEEALGYQALLEEGGDLDRVCGTTGKSRQHVQSRLDLLKLPKDV